MKDVIFILLITLLYSCQKEAEKRYSDEFIEQNSIKVFEEIVLKLLKEESNRF